MQTGERGRRFEAEPGLSREAVMERVNMSREHVRAVFDTLPPDRLHAPCADDWATLGPVVPGPLDALWFAYQMITHAAYHLGQINYIVLLGGEADA
jgi:hypothetical protein